MNDNVQEEMNLGEPENVQVVDGNAVVGDTSLNKPEDVNAYIYHTFYPQFCSHVSKLTSAELKRLLVYLIGYPLEVNREDVQFKTDEGLTAFTIGLRLMQAQFGLTLKALHDNMNNNNQEPEQVTETTQEKTDGETNGSGDDPQI